MVKGSIASLKVALRFWLIGTPVPALAGTVKLTVGGDAQSNGIGIQGNRASPRQRPAFHRGAGLQRDRGQSQDVSLEGRNRSQSRGTADLPIDIGRLGAAAQDDFATDGRGQSGSH